MLDAYGKEIAVGAVVTHTQPGNSLSGKRARVIALTGHSVITDLKTTVTTQSSPRARPQTHTVPPVFLASLVEVVG